jgi:hypothetical protein
MQTLLKKLLLPIIILLVLTSCSVFVPKEHLIPKEKLASALQKKFPIRYEDAGGLVSIVIDSPKLTLVPEQNRVSIKGHYIANATLLEIKGDFVFSSKLTFDKEKRAIFLNEARFDSFEPSGGFFEQKLRTVLNHQVSLFVSENPIYTFKPDELVVLGVKVEVEAIDVVTDGILLKLRRQ